MNSEKNDQNNVHVVGMNSNVMFMTKGGNFNLKD